MHNGADERSLQPGRRTFLRSALGMWGLAAAIPVLKILYDYLTPQTVSGLVKESLVVATTDQIAPGTAKVVRFGRDPVIVVHLDGGQFKAFSARCTHLGCIVQYHDEPVPHFGCNCHGSQFNINGVNYAGPAPKPLAPFRVTLEGTSIVVSTT